MLSHLQGGCNLGWVGAQGSQFSYACCCCCVGHLNLPSQMTGVFPPSCAANRVHALLASAPNRCLDAILTPYLCHTIPAGSGSPSPTTPPSREQQQGEQRGQGRG
jgi:hypothetical protein